MIRKSIIVLAAAAIAGNVSSQDIHFSQYFVNPLFSNPALAGAHANYDIGIQYRDFQMRLVTAV